MTQLAVRTITIKHERRFRRQQRRTFTEVLPERLGGQIQRVPNMAGREVRRFAGVQKNNGAGLPELPGLLERDEGLGLVGRPGRGNQGQTARRNLIGGQARPDAK